MSFSSRRLLFATALVFLGGASFVCAQSTRTWVGTTDNNWTVSTNWNAATVPISGDTAQFNGTGNGHTSITLGGATQPIKNILFDTASFAAYTLGALSSGDKFNFDPGGAITMNSTVTMAQLVNAAVQINSGLTVTNSASATLTLAGDINFASSSTLTLNDDLINAATSLNGNISEVAGQHGALSLQAANTSGSNNSFILSGSNSYTGPTTIAVNTGSTGGIQLGSDSPFGTGLVTVNLVSGGTAPQFGALTATRTIGNAFKLNSGMTFVGSNSFVFTGPFSITNATAPSRSLINSITTSGKTVTFGATPGLSTITLGNPVANGGDGIGKTAVFDPIAGTTTIINDTMQDPAVGGGAASGSVQYAGAVGGITQIKGLSTYTGLTNLTGSSTVQFGTDYNAGDPSGPFGVGTISANSSSNIVLQPIGGNRTIANPVTMIFGLTVSNAASDTSSVALTGPIALQTTGRFINNNFSASGGTLTLGSSASPSTFTLPTGASQTVTIAGTGTTIINDVIQNPGAIPSPPPAINVTNTGTTAFNGLSTYTGDTSLGGNGSIIRIGASSNNVPGPSFTAGPFGTGTINAVSPPTFQPFGADRTVANAITMTTGLIMSNATIAQDPTGNHNLALTGPITLGATPRNITNNLNSGVALTLGSAASPSTIALGSALTIRTQVAGGGSTIVNDAITGVGGLIVQDSAVVQLNGTNNYGGTTSVTGTGTPKLLVNGTKTGTGTVTVDSVGTLGGSGSIVGDITNNGKIAPGNSVGTLTATGNVTMGTNSHLAIELSGATADKLVVGGSLNLSNVDFLDISGAGSGLSWVIASYTGTLTGTFNTVTPGFTVSYGTGTNSQITLNASPSGVKGDFNNDGKVDAGDYATWRKNNGTNNALTNDNGLGTPVGPAHYSLWRANFGKPPGSGSGALDSGGAVPEPASVLLLLFGIVGSCVQLRRRCGA